MSRRKPSGVIWKRGVWKPIPGFPGYEASFAGRVRDVGNEGDPVIVKSTIGPCGFYTLNLGRFGNATHQVGKLTAAAWIGPMPAGSTLRYLDGNLQNHTAANLAYGTRQQFYEDQEARAIREEAAGAPTHCDDGHRYANHWFGGWGERVCHGCRRMDHRRAYVSRVIQDKQCMRCDGIMHRVHYSRRLCDDCGGGRVRGQILQDKPCRKCGALMKGVHYTRRNCDDCGGPSRPRRFRDRPCQLCGDLMIQVPYQRKACRPCRALPGIVQDKPCDDCGQQMKQVHYTRRLCDTCRHNHTAEYRERYKAAARKGPRISHCIDCSAEVVNTGPGPLAKRCDEHKALARQEASRRFEEKRRNK